MMVKIFDDVLLHLCCRIMNEAASLVTLQLFRICTGQAAELPKMDQLAAELPKMDQLQSYQSGLSGETLPHSVTYR